jgi:exopolysaccharide production protein ExoZ
MVILVHLLRAAAALAVMFAHVHQTALATGIGDYVPDFTIGAAGVDLFFVISGFVMVISSASLFGHATSPVYFFLRRVARIVPLYWLASGAALYVNYLIWAHFEPTNISFRNIITSPFFIPDARPNGVVQPIYSLGWTLNFEMAFYVAFSVFLLLRPRLAVLALSILMLGVAYVAPRSSLPLPFSFWANPIIAEFVFGMLIGLARLEGLRLPNWLSSLLAASGAAWFAVSWGAFWQDWPRELSWGLPAALLVAAGGLARTELTSRGWIVSFLILVGDASYALYLFHPFAAILPYRFFGRFLAPASAPHFYAVMIVISCIASAIVIHVAIERPITARLQRLIGRRFAPSEMTLAIDANVTPSISPTVGQN